MTPPVHFLHIAKTGGMTIWQVINANYERVFLNGSPFTFKENYEQHGRNAEITIGHTPYSMVRNYFPQTTRYFTFLREPLSWLVSYYNFQNLDTTQPDHAVAAALSIEDFYLSGQVQLRDNFQTRMLLTEKFAVAKVTQPLLEDAKNNLSEHIEIVGLTEEFDESLMLLKHSFGWDHILYCRDNVTENLDAASQSKSRLVKKSDLPDELVERLLAINQHDVALYKYGESLMAKQKTMYGPSFTEDFNTYRIYNAQYQKDIANTAAKISNAAEKKLANQVHQLEMQLQAVVGSKAYSLGMAILSPIKRIARLAATRNSAP